VFKGKYFKLERLNRKVQPLLFLQIVVNVVIGQLVANPLVGHFAIPDDSRFVEIAVLVKKYAFFYEIDVTGGHF